MTDAEKRIREALAAGPTPGPWRFVFHTIGLSGQHSHSDDWTVYGPNDAAICFEGGCGAVADPAFIAACHPAAISELLAERDALKLAVDAARILLAERDALKAENASLREMLAHLYAGSDLYSDDGELQDARAEPFIDFKRDTAADIRCAMVERKERA